MRRRFDRWMGFVALLAAASTGLDAAAREPDFSVEVSVSGPAATRVVQAQADVEEAYPAMFVLDRNSNLLDYAAGSGPIEAVIAEMDGRAHAKVDVAAVDDDAAVADDAMVDVAAGVDDAIDHHASRDVDADAEADTDAAGDGPQVLERLRIPADRLAAARAIVAAHDRTIVLLAAEPCPPCRVARERVLAGRGYGVIVVEHRPRAAPVAQGFVLPAKRP